MSKRDRELEQEESNKRKAREAEQEEEEEESSEYESEEEEEDDDYESIKMTQKQYNDYVSEINSGYNNLTNNLQSYRSKVAREGNVVSVQSSLNTANSLYENSRKITDSHYKNEVTNMDSKAIREIGEQASMGLDGINLGVTEKGLDFDEFLMRFAKYARQDLRVENNNDDDDVDEDVNAEIEDLYYQGDSNDSVELQEFYEQFNWNKMSSLYYKNSYKVPTIDFMLGPLDVEFKKRKINRAEKDYLKTGQATRPNQVQLNEIVNNQEQDTYQSAIHCYEILESKNDEKMMNLFEFFINPNSFSQSIENLFYTSFLINHNKLALLKDDDGIPMIKIHSNDKLPDYISGDQKNDTKSHLIFKLEYDTWLKLIESYDIKSAFLGDRKSTI